MELSGVIALVLVSFVNGTPYGYGVKSGALAKADANAASGAVVQPVSLTIPSGASFTGSFSKSSSSSFASSSSSAHSSSFSFSGSGANGIGGIGCNSNNCKNGLSVVPLHGSTFNGVQNSGAFASAASEAIAGSLSNQNSNLCKEGNCNGANTSGNKCLSGKCSSNDNLQSQSQPTLSPNKYKSEIDCPSGQCNPSVQQGNAPSGYGSQQQPNDGDSKDKSPETSSTGQEDDIFVALSHSTDSTHQKPSVVLNNPNLEPACASHTCNQASLGSYSNGNPPSSYNVPILGTYPSAPQASTAPACTSPNCAGYLSASNIVSGPTKHLDSSNPDYGAQYQPQQNVPTYAGSTGSVDTDQLLGSSKPSVSKLPSNEDSTKHTVGSTNSINGNVQGSYPSNFITGAPSSSPSYSSQNLHPGYSVGSSQNEAQNSEAYSNESAGSQQVSLDLSKPNTNYLSPGQQQKPHGAYRPTGSNGENLPSGSFSLKPHTSTYTFPSYPGHSTDLSRNVESSHRGPAYTGGFGSPSESINGNFGHGSFLGFLGTSNQHSSAVSPVKDAPTYTGGFGAPTKAFDVSFPAGSKPTSKQSYEGNYGDTTYTSPDASVTPKTSTSTSSPYPKPSVPGYYSGFGGPTGTFGGNFGHGSSQGSLSTIKPNLSSISPVKDIPTYTGGFGGPAGAIDASFPAGTKPSSKPGYEVDHVETTHTSAKPSTGSSSPYNPSIPAYTGGFGGPGGSFVGHFGHNSPHGSQGPSTKPHYDSTLPGNDVPIYTGGFGGPAGAIDASFPAGTKPSSKPGYELDHVETTHTSAKPSTGSSSPYNPSIPAYTGGFGGQGGSFVGHFGHNSPHGSQGPSTKPHDSTLPEKDVPIYTGGFGGPAGPVDKSFPVKDVETKPEHDKKPSFTDNLPHQIAHTSSDAGGNSISNIHSVEHGAVSKPSNTLVPPHHDITNNGLHGSTTAAHLSNTAKPKSEESKIPPYTGGFGAPSGLLKLNEYNLPERSPSSALGNINPLPCTSGACDSKAKSGVTSEKSNVSPHESSGAVSASAKAVAYTGGFRGPPGLLKPFDDGKHLKANHGGGSSPNQATTGQAQAGAQAHASAQANAVAFASAGAFGANQGFSGTGCNSGCKSDDNSEGNLANIDHDSIPKTDFNELNHAAGASAVAKSIAESGAGSLATGRSFASAHASAGAAVKGGYGK